MDSKPALTLRERRLARWRTEQEERSRMPQLDGWRDPRLNPSPPPVERTDLATIGDAIAVCGTRTTAKRSQRDRKRERQAKTRNGQHGPLSSTTNTGNVDVAEEQPLTCHSKPKQLARRQETATEPGSEQYDPWHDPWVQRKQADHERRPSAKDEQRVRGGNASSERVQLGRIATGSSRRKSKPSRVPPRKRADTRTAPSEDDASLKLERIRQLKLFKAAKKAEERPHVTEEGDEVIISKPPALYVPPHLEGRGISATDAIVISDDEDDIGANDGRVPVILRQASPMSVNEGAGDDLSAPDPHAGGAELRVSPSGQHDRTSVAVAMKGRRLNADSSPAKAGGEMTEQEVDGDTAVATIVSKRSAWGRAKGGKFSIGRARAVEDDQGVRDVEGSRSTPLVPPAAIEHARQRLSRIQRRSDGGQGSAGDGSSHHQLVAAGTERHGAKRTVVKQAAAKRVARVQTKNPPTRGSRPAGPSTDRVTPRGGFDPRNGASRKPTATRQGGRSEPISSVGGDLSDHQKQQRAALESRRRAMRDSFVKERSVIGEGDGEDDFEQWAKQQDEAYLSRKRLRAEGLMECNTSRADAGALLACTAASMKPATPVKLFVPLDEDQLFDVAAGCSTATGPPDSLFVPPDEEQLFPVTAVEAASESDLYVPPDEEQLYVVPPAEEVDSVNTGNLFVPQDAEQLYDVPQPPEVEGVEVDGLFVPLNEKQLFEVPEVEEDDDSTEGGLFVPREEEQLHPVPSPPRVDGMEIDGLFVPFDGSQLFERPEVEALSGEDAEKPTEKGVGRGVDGVAAKDLHPLFVPQDEEQIFEVPVVAGGRDVLESDGEEEREGGVTEKVLHLFVPPDEEQLFPLPASPIADVRDVEGGSIINGLFVPTESGECREGDGSAVEVGVYVDGLFIPSEPDSSEEVNNNLYGVESNIGGDVVVAEELEGGVIVSGLFIPTPEVADGEEDEAQEVAGGHVINGLFIPRDETPCGDDGTDEAESAAGAGEADGAD